MFSINLTEPENGLQPTCIFAQTEITGVLALKNTNLKNLGLTSGRSMIRFSWKTLSAEQLKDIEQEILNRQSRLQRLEQRRKANADKVTNNQTTAVPTEDDLMDVQKQEQSEPVANLGFRSVFNDGPVVSSFGNQNNGRSMFDHSEPEVKREPPKPVESMFGSGKQSIEQTSFVNFKFPEETKGQNLYKNEFAPKNVADLTKPCDREAILFDTNEAKQEEPVEEISDDFYEVTREDLQKMHDDLVKQASFTFNSGANRYEKYERAIVRIHFPAQNLVLQAVFQPTEPVYNLYKFVKSHLQGEQGKLVLFTPPRRILNENDFSETFLSSGLLPAVNIYATSSDKQSKVLISDQAREALLVPFDQARKSVSK